MEAELASLHAQRLHRQPLKALAAEFVAEGLDRAFEALVQKSPGCGGGERSGFGRAPPGRCASAGAEWRRRCEHRSGGLRDGCRPPTGRVLAASLSLPVLYTLPAAGRPSKVEA